MRKFKLLICVSLLFYSISFAQESSEGIQTWLEENDGSPSVIAYKTKVSNGSLIDNSDGTVSLTTGSGAPADATYITQTPNSTLSAEQALSGLTTGLAIITNGTGVITTTANNSTNWDTAYTDRLKWDGGATGLTAATGRTSLELGSLAILSSVDISSNTNLAGDTEIVLTGDALSIASTITRDTELSVYAPLASPTFTTQITTPKIVSAGDMTIDAVNAAANSTVYVLNSNGTYAADLNVEGDLVVTDVTVSTGGTLQLGQNGTDGLLKIYSEQGVTDYIASLYSNTAMTSAASFYLPADEPAAESFLKMGIDGIIDYDTTVLGSIATQAANNVSISGGSVTGITDLTVADGGTGKSSWTQYLIPYADTTTSFSQIAIGTSGQVLTSNGAGSAPTFQASGGTQSKSFIITNPTSSADSAIGSLPAASTITQIRVLCVGGTSITGGLDETDANGANAVAVDADIVASAGTIATDDGSLTNPSIDANDQLYWHTTSVSGAVTKAIITVYYTTP